MNELDLIVNWMIGFAALFLVYTLYYDWITTRPASLRKPVETGKNWSAAGRAPETIRGSRRNAA